MGLRKNHTRYVEVYIMNKKVTTLTGILVVLLMLFLNACVSKNNWKTVEIEGYGNIKVPQEWNASVVDGYMYLSAENGNDRKSVLIQHYFDKDVNAYFSDVEEFIWLQDENFSNSAGIIKKQVHYTDGTTAELFTLYFTEPNDLDLTEFICVDKSVPEDTLRKIAKSFVMCEKADDSSAS